MSFWESAPRTEKLWGAEYLLASNNRYCSKVLTLNYGFQSSLHYHKEKDETFIVLEGPVYLEIETASMLTPTSLVINTLKTGDSFRLRPYTAHRFYSGPAGAIVLEVGTAHSDEDVFRLETSRARGECSIHS